MDDYKRLFLFGAIFFVAFQLYEAWQKDYPTVPEVPAIAKTAGGNNSEQHAKNSGTFIPEVNISAEASPPKNSTVTQLKKSTKEIISIETDVFDIRLDAVHGNIVSANLTKYGESAKQPDKPFKLMMDDTQKYLANSGVFVKTAGGVKNIDVDFAANQTHYQMDKGKKTLQVVLTGQTPDGVKVDKIYTFKRGQYLIGLSYKITNGSQSPWVAQLNAQFAQENPKEDKSSIFHVGTYSGAAISDPAEKLYKKVSFADIAENNLNQKVQSGWIAMQQHYFLTAFVPQSGTTNHFYSRYVNNQYIIGMVSQPFKIEPGKSLIKDLKLYAGPEVTSELEKIAPGLNLTIDFGILSVISLFIFSIMSFIHKYVGNWGWSIVLVTVLIKAVFYQLSAKSYKSMAAMRRLQPQITALRERYVDDKAKLSQETMALYQKEKVNPLGGCLPIVIQIPVFIALYWVLLESVELRQAPWILWIHDLSDPDPYYILPIVMGLSMLIQQKLGPASPDPTQAKMMMFLPLLFTFLFMNFPSGLVLYWTVNNVLSILQQWYITKKYGDAKPTDTKKKMNRGNDLGNKKLAH